MGRQPAAAKESIDILTFRASIGVLLWSGIRQAGQGSKICPELVRELWDADDLIQVKKSAPVRDGSNTWVRLCSMKESRCAQSYAQAGH